MNPAVSGGLPAAIALTAELGRVACPLPVLDGFMAVRLAGPLAWLADGIAAATVCVLVASPESPESPAATPASSWAASWPRNSGRRSWTCSGRRPRWPSRTTAAPFRPRWNTPLSLMYVIGGGTNDIQRGLIARALGLPRQA